MNRPNGVKCFDSPRMRSSKVIVGSQNPRQVGVLGGSVGDAPLVFRIDAWANVTLNVDRVQLFSGILGCDNCLCVGVLELCNYLVTGSILR